MERSDAARLRPGHRRTPNERRQAPAFACRPAVDAATVRERVSHASEHVADRYGHPHEVDCFQAAFTTAACLDEVAADSQRAALFGHGWYTRVRRNGRALQTLTNAGCEHEGSPLRRSMIEHAVAVSCALTTRRSPSPSYTTSVDSTLLTGHRETWRKIAGSKTDGWVVTAEDLNPVANAEVPKSSESRTPDMVSWFLRGQGCPLML